MEPGGLSDEQLHALRRVLRDYGRLRFPALHAELDDLVAQTLSDLWEFLASRHAGSTGSINSIDRAAGAGHVATVATVTAATAAPVAYVAKSEVWRLAYTLFRRRAADAYRKSAQRWALGMGSLDGLAEADQADPADARQRQSLLYQRMLRICVAELARADPRDRWLLSGITGLDDAPRSAMPARDRQRLHRLRRRLAEAVRRELGEDAQRLLREDI
jgi:hypothetical protein